ncbi:hypothetical protein CHLRE_14g625100v5 [Chlamydomonas reinhardtii]|uniref:Uncharacterized protein n=1 Tax=Chlamydomonas reinhardtii TaxID=3055 RepID=A8IUE6_CHLRE|nr:uncharacterized protein CHLRE_14g625100v5 [Chlamydomonas reinhardtii]PNW73253.1 hypothetical protein CHLRE_14g625100v5 [Chlamydomonas reinhardtii]|eukprot:XP_001692819.1 predicted protein [Chlamydomonas reinhardtii]
MSTPRLLRHVSNLREEESLLTQMVREATAAYEHVLGLVQAVRHMPSEARVHMVLESLLRQQAVGCTIPHTHSDSVLESRLLCQAAAHLKALRELRVQLGAVQSQLHAALDGLYDRTAASAVAARAHSGSSTVVAAAAAESSGAQPEAPEQLSSPSHQQQWQRSSTIPGSPSSSPQASSSAASSARTVIIRDGDEENDATYDSGFAASAGGGSSGGRYEQYKQCPQHLLAAELVLTSPRQLGRRRREANSSACSRRAAAAAVRSLFGNNHGAAAGVSARVNSGGAGGAASSDSSVFDLISLSSACPSPPLPSWGCSAATVAAGSIRHQRHAAVLCSKEGRQGPEQQLQPMDQMQESWSFADAASSMSCDLVARDVYHPKSGRHLDLSPSRQSPAAAPPATIAATSSNMVRSGPSLHAVSVMLPGGGVLPANYQLTPEAKAWFEDLRKRAEEAEAQQLAMEMASPTGSGGSSSRIDLVAADSVLQQSAAPSAAAAGLCDEFCNQHYQPSEGGDFDFPSPPPPPAYEESWQHPTLMAGGAVAGRRGDSATEACCTGDVDTQTGSGPSWTAHTTASGYGTGGMAACWPAAAGATGVMACGAAGHVQLDSDGYGYCWKRLEQEATAMFADEFEGFNDIPLTDRSGAPDASDEQQDEEEEEEQEWPPRDQEVLDALIAEGASNAYASEVVQGVPFTYYTKAVFTPRKWN